jgi:hypothetical protein
MTRRHQETAMIETLKQAQEQMNALVEARSALLSRFTGGGAAIRAKAAQELADGFRAEAGIWEVVPSLSGDLGPDPAQLLGRASALAALHAEDSAGRWQEHAHRAYDAASQVEREAARAFEVAG